MMKLLKSLFYRVMLSAPAFILATLFTGCSNQPVVRVPAGVRLVAKYQVLDEVISPQHAKCGDTVKDFLKAGLYTCSFRVEELEFDIEDKYLVDSAGHLLEFRVYLAEGPVVYGLKELATDSVYMREKGLGNFHIAIASNAQSILDGADTIAIERVFPTEKLILARQSAHLLRGRRLIYQYSD